MTGGGCAGGPGVLTLGRLGGCWPPLLEFGPNCPGGPPDAYIVRYEGKGGFIRRGLLYGSSGLPRLAL